MAWVFKNSEGYLGIGFYLDGDLHRPYLRLKSNAKNDKRAEDIAKDVESEIRLGIFDFVKRFPDSKKAKRLKAATEANAPKTLGQQARIWLASYAKQAELEPQVVYDYECLFRVFLDRTDLGAMDPAKVVPRDIIQAMTSQSKDRARRFLQRLRLIYFDLRANRLVTENPTEFIKNPKRKRRKRGTPQAPDVRKLIDGLSAVEWVALLNAATGQDLTGLTGQNRNLIGFGTATGLRPKELLTVHDTDLNSETLKLFVRGTKNEWAERVIDLNKLPASLRTEALNAFRAQLRLRAAGGPGKVGSLSELRERRKTNGRPTPKLLFVNTRGGKLDLTNWRERQWNKIVERAGLEPVGEEGHHTPYAMRHTFTMTMIRNGVDMETTWKILGHTGPEMITRYYGRSYPETAAQPVNRS